MSATTESFKIFLTHRLTAAAVEIFEVFEKTTIESQAKLRHSEREIERLQRLLDIVYKPEIRLHRTGSVDVLAQQHHIVQQLTLQSDQGHPYPPRVKKEQEDLWSCQDAKPHQQLALDTEYSRQYASPASTESVVPQLQQNSESSSSPGHHKDSRPSRTQVMLDIDHHDRDTQMEEGICSESYPVPDTQTSTEADVDWTPCHESQRGSSCHLSTRHFTREMKLMKHSKEHHGKAWLSCSACGKAFPNQSLLRRHMDVHSNWRPFNCGFCEKRFKRKVHLIDHERIHTGERPYHCTHCHMNFSQRSSVRSHLRSKHKVQLQHLSRECAVITQKSKSLKEERFSSTLCGQGFIKQSLSDVGTLETHINST